MESSHPISKSPKIYSAGIIGCGWVGCGISSKTREIKQDNHARAYKENPRIDLKWMADIDKERLMKTCKIWDIKTMIFGLEVLKTNHAEISTDIISVCTPVETHCEIVCDIVPYVKAIYCEKPIARSLREADLMIEMCHKYGVILQINHQRNFMRPKFRFSRGWVHTGTHAFALLEHLFGKIISVNHDFVNIGYRHMDIDIEYVDTDEHIFEFDCTHNKERMIPYGVQNLVDCLDYGWESEVSGEQARKALEICLEMEKLNEKI